MAYSSNAQRELGRILEIAQKSPTLRARIKSGGMPKAQAGWRAEVELISAAKMKRLNAQYRGKDYATDVLSFGAPEPMQRLGVLGELVICTQVLERQARECGHSPSAELRVLLVHGVLHLLGMDHEQGGRQEKEMRKWEEKLLKKLARPGARSRTGLIGRASS